MKDIFTVNLSTNSLVRLGLLMSCYKTDNFSFITYYFYSVGNVGPLRHQKLLQSKYSVKYHNIFRETFTTQLNKNVEPKQKY